MKYIVTITEGGPGEVREFDLGPMRIFRATVGSASEPVELTDDQAAALRLRGKVEPAEAAVRDTPRRKTADVQEA